MDRSQKLSDTEYEIMEVLWNSEAPMSASQIFKSILIWLNLSDKSRHQNTML